MIHGATDLKIFSQQMEIMYKWKLNDFDVLHSSYIIYSMIRAIACGNKNKKACKLVKKKKKSNRHRFKTLCGLVRCSTVAYVYRSVYFGWDVAETTMTWSSSPPGARGSNIIRKALLSHALACLWLFPHLKLLTMCSTSMPISRSSWSAVLASSK